jgi:DNA-directed RNA polymerase beta subunit
VEITPKNVQLIEPDDFEAHRSAMFSGVKDAVNSLFPKAHGGVRMDLHNLDYDGPDDFTPQEQKEAMLSNKFVTRKLRGTVTLTDEKSGEQLDQQHTTLMHVPWLSQRGTFIHGGNDYAPISQMRLVSGPFARTLSNGQFEVHFNAKPGTGSGYRVLLEPDTAQYKLRVGPQMHAHLYSVLHDMGVPDQHLEESWGKDILARNKAKYNPKALVQVYGRLVPPKEQNPDASPSDKAKQLHAAFDRTQLLASTVRANLPTMLDQVKQASAKKELRDTDMHDADDIDATFEPDLTPTDLRENVNALHGKAGPALAGGAWPDKWSTPQDNLGWLGWYDQYHHGRRSEDDRSQIQRWLRFREAAGGRRPG